MTVDIYREHYMGTNDSECIQEALNGYLGRCMYTGSIRWVPMTVDVYRKHYMGT